MTQEIQKAALLLNNERLDIIEDFISNDAVISSWREALSKWMDIERQCSIFFKLALEEWERKGE